MPEKASEIKSAGITRIFETYAGELSLVEDDLASMFKSDAFLIPVIGKHLVGSGGKRLRPLFHLAAASLAGYGGREHIAVASIIESIHTASLLHDDVVDGADLRRGKPSAHSIWGNQVVVLVGDFLYSNALRRAVSLKDQRIMDVLSHATTTMTEGELLQLQKAGDPGISESQYIDIVTAKTGVLISAACRLGAVLGRCTSELEEALGLYGLKAGIAFQMADDILDYMAGEGDLGKKIGKDLDEGKVTLPLIVLLRSVTESEREEVEGIVGAGPTEKGLERIMQLFDRYDTLKESMERARTLIAEAKAELLVFPESASRENLLEMADYALAREK